MLKRKWRIVLDTSVFIAALRSNYGAAAQILAMILARNIVNCMDLKMTYEYRDVAMRSDQLVASKRTLDDVERLIRLMEDAAEFVDVTRRYRPLSSDPADDFILDVAINGSVDVLITNNLKHMVAPGRRFGIQVLSPADFLEKLEKES